MTLDKSIRVFFIALVLVGAGYIACTPAHAGGSDDDECNGVANCNDTHLEGGSGGAGGDGGPGGAGGAGGSGGDAKGGDAAGGEARSEVVVSGELGGHGGQGGGAKVNSKSESSSIYLGAARDTADCFTKVQLGAEGFGVAWSRSDEYCKKVRRIFYYIKHGKYEAAAKLECTLDVWKEVYGHKKPRTRKGEQTDGYTECLDDLTLESSQTGIYMPRDEYEELVAQVAQEEYVEHTETIEARFVEYDEQLDAATKQRAADEREIARLKREAAALRAKQDEDDARRAKARANRDKLEGEKK